MHITIPSKPEHMIFLGIKNIFCLSTIFHCLLFLSKKTKKQKTILFKYPPFSCSSGKLAQFCSRRPDLSKVTPILLKRKYLYLQEEYFRKGVLAKRFWETFVWQFWEFLQVTVSLHSYPHGYIISLWARS